MPGQAGLLPVLPGRPGLFFSPFDLLPGQVLLHLPAEKPGVTVHHLFTDPIDHVVNGKISLLLFDLTVDHDLVQHVSQLLAQIFRILVVDGLQDLSALLHQILFHGLMGLDAVPGTAVLLIPELLQDLL